MEQPRLRDVFGDGARLIGRFLRARPYSYAIGALGALLFVTAIVASALVIGWVTETLIIPVLDGGASYEDRLWGAVAAVVGIAIWKAIGIVLRRTGAGYSQFRTSIDLREQMLDHQLRLEAAWFDQQATGELMSISENDTNRSSFILAPLPFATGVVLLLIVSTGVLFALDVRLGLIALFGAALTITLDIHGMWRTFTEFQEALALQGVVGSVAHESFDGALTVKALGREDAETRRFRHISEAYRDRLVHVARTFGNYRAFVEAIPSITTLAVLWVGTALLGTALSTGDLVSAVYLLSLVSLPIRVIGYLMWDLAESTAAWRRVEAILATDDFVRHGTTAARTDRGGAQVDTASVAFAYPNAETVVTDVTFEIPAGLTVALVGTTGSGKSTIAVLLARLWDPHTGSIALDQRDLRDLAPGALPAEMAYVPQETFLFDDTIRGNIRLGADVDDHAIEQACRLAGADEFISELPDGYDTLIGERGTTLSGGQRQRIALARALVRRPRLLILDDATSAIDPSVEAAILRRLRTADLPSTILIVAYRPSSIALTDQVVFIEEGRVVAQGPHGTLLREVPAYATLLHAYEDDARARAGGEAR